MSESDIQRTRVGAGDGAAAAARCRSSPSTASLQHPLSLRMMMPGARSSDQALETVVAVDDATVEVVQVGGRETTTVQPHQRTQVRRINRDDLTRSSIPDGCPNPRSSRRSRDASISFLDLSSESWWQVRCAIRRRSAPDPWDARSSEIASAPINGGEGILAELIDGDHVSLPQKAAMPLSEVRPGSVTM